MKRFHLRNLVSLLCFLAIATGCQTEEQKARKEILAVFEEYKKALHSTDPAKKMYPLLSGVYLTDFKNLMDYALYANEEKLRLFSFEKKAMILTMRHKIPSEVLASGDRERVLKGLFQDVMSLIPEDTPLTNLQFTHDITAVGVYHTGLYSKSIQFNKNQSTGLWLIDPRGDYRTQKEAMQNLIEENKAKGITEEDMLRTVVFGLSASQDSVLKWEPLMSKVE